MAEMTQPLNMDETSQDKTTQSQNVLHSVATPHYPINVPLSLCLYQIIFAFSVVDL